MNCLVVIPARWGSTRLPGKPLLPIAGQPLLARTVDLARRALRDGGDARERLVVATDDDRVEALAATLGCETIRTDPSLSSGSSRAFAAARACTPHPDAIVNLQGDAPFLPVAAVRGVIDALSRGAAVATPAATLNWDQLDQLRAHKQASPFSGTTCTVAPDGTAHWFSKQIIPAIRDEQALRQTMPMSPIRRHLGLYGYRFDTLERFEAAPMSFYERMEGLEQLRFMDLGIPIDVVAIEHAGFEIGGIDTLEDVALAEALIARHGDPYGP